MLRHWLADGYCLLLTTAPSPTLPDNFSLADNQTVGTSRLETAIAASTGAAIISNQLKLSS